MMDSSGSDSLDFSSSSMDEDSSRSVCFNSSLSTEDHSKDDDASNELDSEGDFDQPLYPESSLTFFKSHLQVFQFALRHRLTKLVFSDLLNLVNNHLPKTNSMVSLYKLKKHFFHLYRDITSRTQHTSAAQAVMHATLSALVSSCPNNCEAEAMEFLPISVEAQLKRRLEGMLLACVL